MHGDRDALDYILAYGGKRNRLFGDEFKHHGIDYLTPHFNYEKLKDFYILN